MKSLSALLIIVVFLFSSCREKQTEVLSDIYITNADSAVGLTLSDAEVNSIFNDMKLTASESGDDFSAFTEKDFNVLVQAFINEEGRVDKINITDPLQKVPAGFAENLAGAFSKLKFRPAVLKGQKVKSQTVIALNAAFKRGTETKWNLALKGQQKNQTGDIQNVNLPANLNDDDFVLTADQMPSPIGGILAIQQKIKYPEIAKRAGIEGRVFITTYLDEKGNVVHTSVIKGLGAGIDENAMEAIKQTKFTPAINKGIPVKSKVTVPIVFKLQ